MPAAMKPLLSNRRCAGAGTIDMQMRTVVQTVIPRTMASSSASACSASGSVANSRSLSHLFPGPSRRRNDPLGAEDTVARSRPTARAGDDCSYRSAAARTDTDSVSRSESDMGCRRCA